MPNELPRVLLLGDSIRLSYQPLVAERLAGRACVVGPAENCQFSLHTLTRLDAWLEELGAPAVVHWNNGLHDIGRNETRNPVQYSLEQYLGNLGGILARLRAAGARTVIWATTTPVHPTLPVPHKPWSWTNADIAHYNAAARQLMQAEGVPVNDLHAVVWQDWERHLCEDRIHLSPAGQTACAEAVADMVLRYL
ncbi:MAG: hypothetical protein A3K19_27565 [Lentisphaerae bacterium RIFOXYB12_FULL_65_16]|nr:MAG: hypothetical protein A3K18_24930 [Lentisphaerae bacterium RIFOXYA12_64_32]OGV86062.1 MAG: hypothetical protein A3K19_27565 [Lentisphaerae bacterium RIFOXYB12_FULL_65_16]